jgi:hypothetical protein
MPKLLERRHWQRNCQTVIVGIRACTGTVERIWILTDGGMLFRGLIHYPREGCTAAGEAMTTFGVFRFHRFSVSEARQASIYAARLALELEPDDSEP